MKKKRNNLINFTKQAYRKGISLITLVITIIVIIILSAAIILTLNNNNPISEANKARYESDCANMQAVFTNAVAKVMAHNRSTISITPGQINFNTTGVNESIGEISYTVTYAMDKKNMTGNIVFDNGDNTDTLFYTDKKLPIYAAGETKWYVDSEGNISLEVAGKKYGIKTSGGDIVQDDEQFELGTEEDLKNKADELIQGSTTSENWVKAIDIYGNEVDMANWYYESNGDGTFDLNTTSNIESNIAGYKGEVTNNTIEGEIPAYIIKCTDGVIEEGKVISLECAFSNLTNLTNLNEDLKIPPEVNNLIGMLQGTGITEIPKCLYNIGSNVSNVNIMFKNCTQLTQITPEFKLGENVVDAGYLFEGTSITTLPSAFKLNEKLSSIEGMFYNSKLEEIESFEITNPVKNANKLFYGTKIKEVPSTLTFHSNVWYAAQMFEKCEQLETISSQFVLPKYVTDVNGMFSGCKNLKAIPNEFTIPNTVKTARYMFNMCEMLSSIPENFVIPDSVTDCSYMFTTCWRMETIGAGFTIGKGVISAEEMFKQCGNLKNINITVPGNVENIKNMFYQNASNRVTGNITLEGIPTQYDQAFYNMGIANSENLINVYVTDSDLITALTTTVGEGKVNFLLKQ